MPPEAAKTAAAVAMPRTPISTTNRPDRMWSAISFLATARQPPTVRILRRGPPRPRLRRRWSYRNLLLRFLDLEIAAIDALQVFVEPMDTDHIGTLGHEAAHSWRQRLRMEVGDP